MASLTRDVAHSLLAALVGILVFALWALLLVFAMTRHPSASEPGECTTAPYPVGAAQSGCIRVLTASLTRL